MHVALSLVAEIFDDIVVRNKGCVTVDSLNCIRIRTFKFIAFVPVQPPHTACNAQVNPPSTMQFSPKYVFQ
jgi:hypothetical protein